MTESRNTRLIGELGLHLLRSGGLCGCRDWRRRISTAAQVNGFSVAQLEAKLAGVPAPGRSTSAKAAAPEAKAAAAVTRPQRRSAVVRSGGSLAERMTVVVDGELAQGPKAILQVVAALRE